MNLADRSMLRRERMTVHTATSFEDAERWDLDYWQAQSPAARLAALEAIRRDIAKVGAKENSP